MTVSRSQPIPATSCKHDVTQDCPACAEETIAALRTRGAELEGALRDALCELSSLALQVGVKPGGSVHRAQIRARAALQPKAGS